MIATFFCQIESGVIIFIDKYKSDANPDGAVCVKGGLITATHDMPEANLICGNKSIGATNALRGSFITEDRIADATRVDVVMQSRTHEVHFEALRVVRSIAVRTHREHAATQAGVCPDANTQFVESIACNCPHQWGHVRFDVCVLGRCSGIYAQYCSFVLSVHEQCLLHCTKGTFRRGLDLLERSLTGDALAELAHVCSAIELFPGDYRFSSFETIASFGFQQLLAFAMYLPFVLRMYVVLVRSQVGGYVFPSRQRVAGCLTFLSVKHRSNLRWLRPDKLRDKAKAYFLHLHHDGTFMITCRHIIDMFASFANMMLVLEREFCHPDSGPIELQDSVFAFRAAAVRAFGPSKWKVPNFIALTQFAISLVWYGASKIASNTGQGTVVYTPFRYVYTFHSSVYTTPQRVYPVHMSNNVSHHILN